MGIQYWCNAIIQKLLINAWYENMKGAHYGWPFLFSAFCTVRFPEISKDLQKEKGKRRPQCPAVCCRISSNEHNHHRHCRHHHLFVGMVGGEESIATQLSHTTDVIMIVVVVVVSVIIRVIAVITIVTTSTIVIVIINAIITSNRLLYTCIHKACSPTVESINQLTSHTKQHFGKWTD